LARACSILVLDEATSHVDTISEAAINASISDLACTRIVIAHRLSSVHDAKVIIVMNEGKIVQRGTHDVLSGMDGLYARLCRMQQGAHV
jgi:ABC-type multidrug transport system fused ATPase/permease subunit